jgi:hypothetical protein
MGEEKEGDPWQNTSGIEPLGRLIEMEDWAVHEPPRRIYLLRLFNLEERGRPPGLPIRNSIFWLDRNMPRCYFFNGISLPYARALAFSA